MFEEGIATTEDTVLENVEQLILTLHLIGGQPIKNGAGQPQDKQKSGARRDTFDSVSIFGP